MKVFMPFQQMFGKRIAWPLCFLASFLLIGLIGTGSAYGQHDHEAMHPDTARFEAPSQAVFGAVQEAIRVLEADPETDWSAVDMEALRQHLIDMHHVAMNVEVVDKEPVEGGAQLTARALGSEARASLERVLETHPMMLREEAGWEVQVETDGPSHRITVTDPEGTDAEKIRALSYIGLLAYGSHHQTHHQHLVQGRHPHAH